MFMKFVSSSNGDDMMNMAMITMTNIGKSRARKKVEVELIKTG